MPINARQKGKRGEREVGNWLNELFARLAPEYEQPVFRRNLMQYADGGYDLENDLGLAIEVKRQEKLHVMQWWKQAVTQSIERGGEPVLLWRQNGERKWHVMICCEVTWNRVSSMPIPVEITQDAFETLLIHRYMKGAK